jgi:uncharacterized protein (DUF2062 family)
MTRPGIETGPDAAKVRKTRGWIPRRLVAALLHLLRQGLSPQKLALGVSLGIGIGCFPVLGTTTLLRTLVAFIFRMNLPAIQAGNLLAWPLQLVLLGRSCAWASACFTLRACQFRPSRLRR